MQFIALQDYGDNKRRNKEKASFIGCGTEGFSILKPAGKVFFRDQRGRQVLQSPTALVIQSRELKSPRTCNCITQVLF